jgi:hypothetical protein
MPRCRHCGRSVFGSRQEIGARCPYCRQALYEGGGRDRRGPATASDSRCAVHAANAAVGTCQRCGNFVCSVCRSRWQAHVWCTACVERALEAQEATPEEVRAHFRQALLSLLLGLAAWGSWLVASILIALAIGQGQREEINPAIFGVALLLLLLGCFPAMVGIGQGAAAIRTRGNHMILATTGLLLCGLNIAVLIGLIGLSLWQNF